VAAFGNRGHIPIMAGTFADDVYVLAATKGGEVEYWAVATRREAEVWAMRDLAAPGWTAALTDRHLTQGQVAELKLRPNGARKLKYAPRPST
jgi:hypothetical protein